MTADEKTITGNLQNPQPQRKDTFKKQIVAMAALEKKNFRAVFAFDLENKNQWMSANGKRVVNTP